MEIVAGSLSTLFISAEGSETTADASASMPILPYLPELVFGLIAFGIIYAIAAKMVGPAMEKMYAERSAAIEGGIERADQAIAEAEAKKAQYEAQLIEARTDAARVRSEAREQGAAIVAEMRTQGQDEAARILDSAQRQIQAERAQATLQLRHEIGALSTELASRIVGESLHEETRQRGTVDRFLAELESGHLTSTGKPAKDAIPKEVDV